MSKIKCFFFLLFLTLSTSALQAQNEFYQLKIYHIKTSAQEDKVDEFLAKAYLPALHKAGIANVGVFKPIIAPDAPAPAEKLIYVFIPFKGYEGMEKLAKKLAKDETYQLNGKDYLQALYTQAPYERIETILMRAFDGHPKLTLPKLSSPAKTRVYELRSYESHTEAIAKNKIDMFNKGNEIGLFKRLGFNAVFYGEVIAGSRMPNLMYLTTFENKADRDAHWKAFSADAYWKELSAMPNYKNNVLKNDTRFFYPTDYSDI